MSIEGLMNQSLTLYPKTGYGGDGREISGSSTTVQCRAQMKTKRVLLPDGSTVTIDGVLYVPASTVVDTDYKAVLSGVNYKVLAKYPVPGGDGQTHHIKLEVVKWELA